MKGQTGVIQALNATLSNELITINQTFLHARMCRNWGYSGLDSPLYKESIRAMKQADDLIERILFLEGLPNLQHLGRLRVGESPEEILNSDLALMTDCVQTLRDGIHTCEQAQDFVSRELLKDILTTEETYYDWLETQQELIQSMGLNNYLQSRT